MSKAKLFIRFLPAVLWYGLIWRMSAQTATASSQSSDSLMGRLFSTLLPDYRNATALTQQAIQELVSFFIRKSAHMFLFFVLALLLWYSFSALIQKRSFRALYTILSCAALAASDEYHQTLVPGRSGEVRDVMVDLLGSLIALLLFALPVIGLWLQQKTPHSELVWPIGEGMGAALLVYVGLLTGPSPLFVSRTAFSPLFLSITAAEKEALLTLTAPILRQILYLFSGAITGFLSVCLATLSGSRRAVFFAVTATVVLSLISGVVWSLPILVGMGLTLAGCGVALMLWILFPLLRK